MATTAIVQSGTRVKLEHSSSTPRALAARPKETLHERPSPARERSRRFGMDRFALVMYAP